MVAGTRKELCRRLARLEARATPADEDDEQVERLRAAVRALLAAFEVKEWSTVPPYSPRPVEFILVDLLQRLETGTETDQDRAKLAALPLCHLEPRQLVEVCARLAATI